MLGGANRGYAQSLPESPHPYPDNYNNTWTYTLSDTATAIDVTFDARTWVEAGWDYIYVMDGNGNNISGSPFTGTSLAGQTKRISGRTVRIRLTSDYSVTGYGFRVTSITAAGTSTSYPESQHPYQNNYDNTWTYTLDGSAAAIDVIFDAQTWVETDYDFVYVMDGNGNNISGSPFTGSSLAGQTKRVTGRTVRIRLTSDGSVTGYGFRVTNVRAATTAQPTVTTSSATAIGQTTATLRGSVNPNGGSTTAWFLWGTSSSPTIQTGVRSVGSGASTVNYDQQLSNLTPNTTYYFRAAAQGAGGSIVYGNVQSFRTSQTVLPPTVTTSAATGVGQVTATLRGLVNPNGSSTTAWFLWGTSSPPGTQSGVRSVGSGTTTVSYEQALSGLTANTTYYFRVAAQGGGGTIVYGSIQSFRTSAVTPPTVTTESATNVTSTGAVLRASVNANGTSTTGWFLWGTTNPPTTQTGIQGLGSGTTTVSYQQQLSSLAPSATYYYRAAAQGGGNTIVYGSVRSFTTAAPQLPESPHPYPDNFDNTWTYTVSGAANAIDVAFDSRTSVEQDYDFIYVMDGNGNDIAGSPFTGTSLAGQTKRVSGRTVRIRLITDGSITDYGFRVTSVSAAPLLPPSITTDAATGIGQSTATLRGTVNPNGTSTTAWFVWGTSSSPTTQTSIRNIGSGTSALSYEQQLSNLNPNTTYYFRAVAQGAGGTIVYGSVQSVTTVTSVIPPTVTTDSATNVGQTNATLRGSVNPNGSSTTGWFLWGTTNPPTTQTSVQNIGSGATSVSYQQQLSNLTSGTTYYYRAAAQGGGNTIVYGSVQSFTTTALQLPESPHPYPDNYDNTWTYTFSEAVSAINVTFDGQTWVEPGYDYIYVMDGNGNDIAGSPFTGTSLAGQTKQVSGRTVRIRLTSDGSVTGYGFRVNNVTGTTQQTTGDDDSTEVGAIWVNNYGGVNGLIDLVRSDDNASGFVTRLRQRLPSTAVNFNLGDAAARGTHFLDARFGGVEDRFVDAVDFAFFSGHGATIGEDAVVFVAEPRESPGDALALSGLMRLGDQDLEWLALDACEVLTDAGWRTAWSSGNFRGLHMVMGFRTTSIDRWGLITFSLPDIGPDLADRLVDGDTISAAWLDVATNAWTRFFGENFPAVISAETSETSTQTMDTDHFHGTGTTVADIPSPRYLVRRFIR